MRHLLKERERQLVTNKLNNYLKDEVRLILFTQEFECEYCNLTRSLAEELSAIDSRVRLEIYDLKADEDKAVRFRVDKVPALLIHGRKEYKVRYFGVPSGYEFSALLDDIIDVSRGETGLSSTTKEQLRSVKRPVHIQVFVTPTCPYCPRAVRLAHQMAIENENVMGDMIESIEFPHLSTRYQVMAVPKVIINESFSFEGALPEHLFLQYVMLAASENPLSK
ncbi:MAG: thioredoxin family protein [Aigarchaeota archaeon]|nr:thioredoxin family protein [Aigarchaeota archaeon]MDW8093191.1 thioredoxin family protein [Nitrososphaerota archaeon]